MPVSASVATLLCCSANSSTNWQSWIDPRPGRANGDPDEMNVELDFFFNKPTRVDTVGLYVNTTANFGRYWNTNVDFGFSKGKDGFGYTFEQEENVTWDRANRYCEALADTSRMLPPRMLGSSVTFSQSWSSTPSRWLWRDSGG